MIAYEGTEVIVYVGRIPGMAIKRKTGQAGLLVRSSWMDVVNEYVEGRFESEERSESLVTVL